MDENSLKQLWLDPSHQQKVEINAEKLIGSINQKVFYMKKKIKRRDKREIILGLIMIPLFGWWLLALPQPLAKIGAGIIILNIILVIFRLIRAGKVDVKDDTASAIKYNLMVSLKRVRQQITLSDTVLWWYLLPFFIGVICFFYAFPLPLSGKAFYTILVAVLYGYIYYLNKRAVKKHLRPLEDDLQKALDELSSGE
jgi:hypothetical protein